jgi:HSP20 family protein
MNSISNKGNLLMASLMAVPACQRQDGDSDWFPAVDLAETDQEYVFEVDLPGLKPDEIQLRVNRDGVCVSGQRVQRPQGSKRVRVERPSGAFLRQLPLPPDAHGEIHATFCDGVLELRVPRAPPEGELGQTHAVAHEPLEAAA